ncbi:hypothetical protein TNCT_348511 [Trichonephila clavata]|uniref:Uncharacterized protein n=1 Tax=Trichonephila clavata TaxID=2740835 RepID=A0A8X6LKN9_TRICU|nr:hypothetical protein TNCT_348511 [Trichonephila clavata]
MTCHICCPIVSLPNTLGHIKIELITSLQNNVRQIFRRLIGDWMNRQNLHEEQELGDLGYRSTGYIVITAPVPETSIVSSQGD